MQSFRRKINLKYDSEGFAAADDVSRSSETASKGVSFLTCKIFFQFQLKETEQLQVLFHFRSV